MIKIDHSRCDRCGTCIALCPVDALALSERSLSVSPACIDCSRCVNICPVAALSSSAGGEP